MLFLSVYVDDIKLAGRKQNIDLMWKVLNKEVDLGEPTSFLDHVYLGCTQRQCEISKNTADNYRTMFESRISADGTETLQHSKNFRISSWSCDMEGPAKKCVERYCELANETTKQVYKVSTPCIDDHHLKEEELKSLGELSKVCSQIVLKCLYLARVGRPHILWSVNKLAQLITKWTRACDKRVNRLISYIHHTCEYKQCCFVCNTAKQCRLGLFQDSDFAGDLEDSKSTSGGTLCVFGSHTFVPISWTCKKQTSVSHSSTESEIISLDAGSRLDGIPALDSWDLIVLVLGNTTQNHDRTEKPVVCRDTSHERHRLVEKAHSSTYSEWNIDKTWSSQERKSDELMDDRTGRLVVSLHGGAHPSQTRSSRESKNVILEEENHDRTERPVVCPQRGAPQHFVIEDDEAESDLSLGSRSFMHRVNDQVRKRQKQSSMDATEDSEEHSVIWGMFVSSTLEASVFMGKKCSDNWHSIKNSKDLAMKQMFDIPES